jgi:hypothetical protein
MPWRERGPNQISDEELKSETSFSDLLVCRIDGTGWLQ